MDTRISSAYLAVCGIQRETDLNYIEISRNGTASDCKYDGCRFDSHLRQGSIPVSVFHPISSDADFMRRLLYFDEKST